MKKNYIVTEGPADIVILKKILNNQILKNTEILGGAGYPTIVSLARSLLSSKNCRVAILIDSDSIDEKTINERYNYVFNNLNSIDTDKNFKIFLFIPSIEKSLFENNVDKEKYKNFFPFKNNRKNINDLNNFMELLSPREIEKIRQSSNIEELIIFLNDDRNFFHKNKIKFEEFWNDLIIELSIQKTIQNWTALNGYTGEDFPAIFIRSQDFEGGGYIQVEPPSAHKPIRIKVKSFRKIYPLWNYYINRKIMRTELRDLTRHSKYIISIYHQYHNLMYPH